MPFSASLRSRSPNPSLCSSHEAPPSDSGRDSAALSGLISSPVYSGSLLPFLYCLYSGRTQKQLIDYVRESEFKKIPFER